MKRRVKCGLAILLILVSVLSVVFCAPIAAAQVTDEAVPAEAIVDSSEPGYEDTLADELFGDNQPAPAEEGDDIMIVADGAKTQVAVTGEEPTQTSTEEPVVAPTQEPTAGPDAPTSVGTVTSVTRKGQSANQIALTWSEVTNATGYNIYWRNMAKTGSKLTLLSSVKGTSLTIQKLAAGSMYQFKVTAYQLIDDEKHEGKGVTVKAGTLPTKPTGLKLKAVTGSNIEISWTKSANIDGYILYRDYKGKWSEYKTLSANTTSFKDASVKAGNAYFYRLYPYRKDSTGILRSAYAQVNAYAGMAAPTDNGSNTRLSRVMLQWNKCSYAQGYDIYASTDNKTFKGVASVKRLYYYTGRYTAGKKYYFRIYPYRMVGNTKVRGPYLGKAFTISDKAYGKNPGKTYVEINIRQQHMWYFVDGKLYVSTDVVTGNRYSNDTPKGYWRVNNKARNVSLVGPGYVSFVRYWMAFIGSGYGIHDASWRSSFGGNIYQGNGSHGCVNTPTNNVKKMYSKMTVGTPVIIY